MAQPASERVYSVAEARARFDELIAAAEAGVTVVITRQRKAAEDVPAPREAKKRDWSWLEEEIAKIPFSPTDSGDLIREMRNNDRY
jgi:antitoxin (DNA-binding transcriptional repressor) of toxin-antitoxin stability system